ncbi:magnesium chelatase domain-containing protein [Candidatus Lariskella endosymbiont of Epinotia ramella]|uniref:magnesium chelatase domain-containing protein n=1 Tax=Candidatus Lariskella endosymbiont of Epinotia ramella TaxID=3066224 RepID=UPI0030D4B437
MVSHITTFCFIGIEVREVDVQTHIVQGLPSFCIVGLPNKTVAESKERIRAAFSSMGLSLPTKRITVNLSPADLNKDGSHFDLPIALGLLVDLEIIPQEELENYVAMGELSLDGKLRVFT